MSQNPYRQLPAVAIVLEHPQLVAARGDYAHDAIATAVRAEIDTLRQKIVAGETIANDVDALVSRVIARLAEDNRSTIRTVINATGIVLHTNLGRSPMAESAALAAYEAARGYLNLELDLATGKRSSRQDNVRNGLCRITGAESATCVNNCAAATVIVLRTLAMGKEVIVSRGQLIEIGGSFRIPDIMTVSGASLREVGTTNITRIGDYAAAIGPNTGAIMRIHTSNFRVRGFTKSVGIEALVELGRERSVPVIDDVGSGAVVDFAKYGLDGEPPITEGIRAGADVALFSGDKLLGGPQVGIIAGKKDWIARIERDTMMRALRLDKMTLAALEATLRLYRDPVAALREIPTLRMLTMPLGELRTRAEAFAERLRSVGALSSVEVREDIAYVGGGSLPDESLPTVVVAVTAHRHSESEMATRLRTATPAVVGRVQDGRMFFDLRTVFDRQLDDLFAAIRHAANAPSQSDSATI